MDASLKAAQRRFEKFVPTVTYDMRRAAPDKFIIKLTPNSGEYMGRKYYLSLEIVNINNKSFPFIPPKIIFLSSIKHVNVYRSGGICLDILKDKWSPSYSFDSIIISILNLLDNPNYNSKASSTADHIDIYEANNSVINQSYDMYFM